MEDENSGPPLFTRSTAVVNKKFNLSRTKILPLEPTLEVVLEVFSGIRSTESEAPCRMSPSHAQVGFSSPEEKFKILSLLQNDS
jgi:hypothetical protein